MVKPVSQEIIAIKTRLVGFVDIKFMINLRLALKFPQYICKSKIKWVDRSKEFSIFVCFVVILIIKKRKFPISGFGIYE